MPGLCPLDELKRKEIDRDRLYRLFTRLGFKSMIEKFGLDMSGGIETARAEVPEFITVDDPIALAGLAASMAEAKEVSICHLLDHTDRIGTRLSGIAFSWAGKNAYVNIGTGISEDQFLDVFGDFFADAGIGKYGHGLKNLIVYLKHKGVPFEGLRFDTIIGAYILDPSRSSYACRTCRKCTWEHVRTGGRPEWQGQNSTAYWQLPAEQVAPSP